MTERNNPFADLGDMPAFERKPKPARPVETAAIDQIAEESGFVSRQPLKPAKTPKRKPRLHRTGRNENFTLKVTKETRERYHRMAEMSAADCWRGCWNWRLMRWNQLKTSLISPRLQKRADLNISDVNDFAGVRRGGFHGQRALQTCDGSALQSRHQRRNRFERPLT